MDPIADQVDGGLVARHEQEGDHREEFRRRHANALLLGLDELRQEVVARIPTLLLDSVGKVGVKQGATSTSNSRNRGLGYGQRKSGSYAYWVGDENLKAKIRYRAQDATCRITELNNTDISVEFEEPRFAIAPGQSVVFYSENICLGGAIIDKAFN